MTSKKFQVMPSWTLGIVLRSVYLCLTVRHKQIGPTLGVSRGLCTVRQYLCINNKMAMCDILCDTLKILKYDMHAHNKYFLQRFYCIHWERRPHYWDNVSLCHSSLKSKRQTDAPWILLTPRSRYSKNCAKRNRFLSVARILHDGGFFTFKSTLAGPSGKNR